MRAAWKVWSWKRLSRCFAALALLGAVSAVVLWLRGYSVLDHFTVKVGPYWQYVNSSRGLIDLQVAWVREDDRPVPLVGASHRTFPPAESDHGYSAGFEPLFEWGDFYVVLTDGGNMIFGELRVPAWFAVGALALPSAWQLARWASRRRRARRLGLCRHCGYDLRGNPASGRCPECCSSAPLLAAPPARDALQ